MFEVVMFWFTAAQQEIWGKCPCDVSGGTWGAYHLARKSGNFGLKSNGKVIFRKFRSEIVEYLQRYSSFFRSKRNGGNFLTICLTFQFPVSHQPKTIAGMVTAISFGWFPDFGKTLTIIQRSSQPVYSDKW